MRKSIKTTIFATVFFIGYAVGFLACGAAYAKGSSTLLRKAAYGVPVSLRDAGKKFLIKFVQSHRKIALKTVLGCI